MLEVQTDRRKEQRKRDGRGNDQRSPDIPEEEKQDDDNQRHALPQIVQYGVAGEMNEIAAVYKRYNLYAARQDSIVQLFHLSFQVPERSLSVCAFPHGDPR